MTYSKLPPLDGIGDAGVLRETDGAIIPADPANTDWQAYLAWVAAGGTTTEPTSATESPQTG